MLLFLLLLYSKLRCCSHDLLIDHDTLFSSIVGSIVLAQMQKSIFTVFSTFACIAVAGRNVYSQIRPIFPLCLCNAYFCEQYKTCKLHPLLKANEHLGLDNLWYATTCKLSKLTLEQRDKNKSYLFVHENQGCR